MTELLAVRLNKDYWLNEYMNSNDIIEIRIDGDKVEESVWKEINEKVKVVYEENHDYQERHLEVLNIIHDTLFEWCDYVDLLEDVPDSSDDEASDSSEDVLEKIL
jgi:hypothetical protein